MTFWIVCMLRPILFMRMLRTKRDWINNFSVDMTNYVCCYVTEYRISGCLWIDLIMRPWQLNWINKLVPSCQVARRFKCFSSLSRWREEQISVDFQMTSRQMRNLLSQLFFLEESPKSNFLSLTSDFYGTHSTVSLSTRPPAFQWKLDKKWITFVRHTSCRWNDRGSRANIV